MVLKQTRQDFQILSLSFSLSYLSIYQSMHAFSRKENEKKKNRIYWVYVSKQIIKKEEEKYLFTCCVCLIKKHVKFSIVIQKYDV